MLTKSLPTAGVKQLPMNIITREKELIFVSLVHSASIVKRHMTICTALASVYL